MSRLPKNPTVDLPQNKEYAQNGKFYEFHTLSRRKFIFGIIHNEQISPAVKRQILQRWIDLGYIYPYRVDSQMTERHLPLKCDVQHLAHFQQNSFDR